MNRQSWYLVVTSNLLSAFVTVIIVLAWSKGGGPLLYRNNVVLLDGNPRLLQLYCCVCKDPDDNAWETQLGSRLSGDATLFNNKFDEGDDDDDENDIYKDRCKNKQGSSSLSRVGGYA